MRPLRMKKRPGTTTSKMILNPEFPEDGLKQSMLNTRVLLSAPDLSHAKGAEEDAITEACQLHWVAEAIRYAYPDAKLLFDGKNF